MPRSGIEYSAEGLWQHHTPEDRTGQNRRDGRPASFCWKKAASFYYTAYVVVFLRRIDQLKEAT